MGFGVIGHLSCRDEKSMVTVQYRTVIWEGIGRFRVRPCASLCDESSGCGDFPPQVRPKPSTPG